MENDLEIKCISDFKDDFCTQCEKKECIQAYKFIQLHNQFEGTELLLKSCPDEEPKTQGNTPEKPDLIYVDDISGKELVVEVKKLYHGFSNLKSKKNTEHALHDKYPKFKNVVSEILYKMADKNEIDDAIFNEYSISLFIKDYIKDDYFNNNFYEKFKNFVRAFLLNMNNNVFQDEFIKIGFEKNYPAKSFGANGIIFQIPTNFDDENGGILISELFNISNDYINLSEEIVRLLKKNTQKFDRYPNCKTIFLFIINPRMGLDIFQSFLPQDGVSLFDGFASKKDEFCKYTFVDSIFIFFEDYYEVYRDESGQIRNRTVDILYDLKEAAIRKLIYD